MLKRILAILLSVSMIFAFAACGGKETGQDTGEKGTAEDTLTIEPQQLTIGTASAGGAFYPIGTGIAEVISSHVEPLTVTAEITGGSVENPRLVGNGETDLGLSNADHVTFALEGKAPFDKAYDVSAICSLHASILHIVTLEKAGISSIEDLRGQKVAVGPAGGGSIPAFTAVLAAYGMTFDDIIPSYLSYDDGMSQLKDGQVKAALAQAGFPAAAVLGLSATDKVVMLSVEDEKMDAISEANPFYTKVVVPSIVYGTESDVTVLGVRNIIYANPNLSEDTVYAITKALYENLDVLKSYHNSLSDVEQATMADTSGVKLHPGAEKYYKEIGVL